ncbi:thiol-disulfide oxidoreductase DCC family protein [Methylotuvimicrobium sp.]|uniref:thiol-disulfide oxidoreductase DCC family protein n=1 Tax=Methylotuvimicrobium sp. TaxID=2822413 RepID=UPI003D6458B5
MNNPPDFTLFYDGHCPICQKEVAWLRRKNQKGRLAFQDIQDENFDPQVYGKTFDDFMAEIHGLYPDGRLIKGVEVFCAAYSAVGLGWLAAPMRWRLLRPLFDRLYAGFARHRLRLGSRFGKKTCDEDRCRF